MKHVMLTSLALFVLVLCRAQDVEFKKRVVYVDGKECLTIKGDPNNVSFLDMKGEELFFLKYSNSQLTGIRYCKVIFLRQHKYFTASNFMFTQKMLVRKLIASGAVKDCALVEDKVDDFIVKYDEHVRE